MELAVTKYNNNKNKKHIPKGLRQKVWEKYAMFNTCYAGCGRSIDRECFQCGHIKAEANGGNCLLDNLRPICSACNLYMGTRHMFDFVRERGYAPLYFTAADLTSFQEYMSEAVDPFQCVALTAKGMRCRNRREMPSIQLCHIHNNCMDCQ